MGTPRENGLGMRLTLALFLGVCLTACGGGGQPPPAGCPANYPSEPCPSGAVCEFSQALACEAGCTGGSYSRDECKSGKWVNVEHTAGAPECYCSSSSSRLEPSLDAGPVDAPLAPEDSGP